MRKVLPILILAFATANIQCAETPNFYKFISHTGKDLIINYKSGSNVSLAYAICDKYSGENKKKHCLLTLESVDGAGLKRLKNCTMELPDARNLKTNETSSYRRYKLAQTSEREVLFAWKQVENKKRRLRNRRSYVRPMHYFQEYVKVRVVDMASCDYREIGVTLENRDEYATTDERKISDLSVMSYGNGSFAMFYRNMKSCMEERCSVEYDAEERKFIDGKNITSTVPYHSSAELYALKSLNSSDILAYVVVENFLEDGSIKLLDPESRQLVEHIFSWSIHSMPTRASNLAISYSHETLGICQQGMFQSRLDCSLFRYDGQAKLGVSLSLKSVNVAVLKMRNAADGGFLVLIGYAKNKTVTVFERIDLLKIRIDGEIEWTKEGSHVSCPVGKSRIDVDFFEVDGQDCCYYMACTRPISETDEINEFNMQFNSKCY